MFRTGCDFAPSLAVQCSVDHGVVDRTAPGGLVSRLHRRHDEHTPGGSLFKKRSQQFSFLLDCEVLTATAAQRFPHNTSSP
jgi:hypothetical protein